MADQIATRKEMPRQWGMEGWSRLDYTLAEISESSGWTSSRNVSWRATIAWRRPLSGNVWLPLRNAGSLAVRAFFLSREFTVFRNPSRDLPVHLFFFCRIRFPGSTVFCFCCRTSTPSLLAVVVAKLDGGVVGRCSCEGTSISLLSIKCCWPVIEQTFRNRSTWASATLTFYVNTLEVCSSILIDDIHDGGINFNGAHNLIPLQTLHSCDTLIWRSLNLTPHTSQKISATAKNISFRCCAMGHKGTTVGPLFV